MTEFAKRLVGSIGTAAVANRQATRCPRHHGPDVARHVAAVALFGEPSSRFLTAINAPPMAIGPLYAPKTINQ